MAKAPVSPERRDRIPQLPTYVFQGKKRSAQFSQGAVAAIQAMRTAGCGEDADYTERLFAALDKPIAKGGDYGRGALAAVCEAIAFHLRVGEPDYDVWTPFHSCWSGENSEIPPDGVRFYDVDGVAYSVDPSLHTLEWRGADFCTARNVDTIRGRSKPISRKRFDKLRAA